MAQIKEIKNSTFVSKQPHYKFMAAMIFGRKTPNIAQDLEKWELPINPQAVNELYTILRKLNPKYFDGSEEVPNIPLIKKLSIEKLLAHYFDFDYLTDDLDGVSDSFELLDNLETRKIITSLIMAKVPIDEIESIVNGKFEKGFNPQGFRLFEDYFFNLEGFSRKERSELDKTFAQDSDTKRNYKIALKSDKNLLLWKLGLNPNKSMEEMLKEMFADSFYIFKEKQSYDLEGATKLGALAIRIAERLDRMKVFDDNAANLFEAIIFDVQASPTNNQISEYTAADLQYEVGAIDYKTKELPEEGTSLVSSMPKMGPVKEPINLDTNYEK